MRYNRLIIGAVEMKADSADTDLGLYNLVELKGLESPVRRISRFQKPGAHGAVISASLYGERVVAASVQILGTSEADYLQKHRALAQECDISEEGLKTITIVDSQGTSYQIIGQVEVFQDDDSDSRRALGRVILSIVCPDFEISSSTLKSSTIYLRDTSGGVGIPTAIPISFGSSVGGSSILTNSGDIASSPIVRLYGPLVNPTITNQETGESLQYNDTILAGEWIEIDMKNKTVTNQSGANKLSSLSTTIRDFWKLMPGDNTIQFYDEGAYNATANCVISWRDTYTSI